jgi:hypothetical protein
MNRIKRKIMIDIYYKKEKEEYAKYLIKRFGGIVNAANVIDEMLKVCPEGSWQYDLKETRKIIFQMNDSK